MILGSPVTWQDCLLPAPASEIQPSPILSICQYTFSSNFLIFLMILCIFDPPREHQMVSTFVLQNDFFMTSIYSKPLELTVARLLQHLYLIYYCWCVQVSRRLANIVISSASSVLPGKLNPESHEQDPLNKFVVYFYIPHSFISSQDLLPSTYWKIVAIFFHCF